MLINCARCIVASTRIEPEHHGSRDVLRWAQSDFSFVKRKVNRNTQPFAPCAAAAAQPRTAAAEAAQVATNRFPLGFLCSRHCAVFESRVFVAALSLSLSPQHYCAVRHIILDVYVRACVCVCGLVACTCASSAAAAPLCAHKSRRSRTGTWRLAAVALSHASRRPSKRAITGKNSFDSSTVGGAQKLCCAQENG